MSKTPWTPGPWNPESWDGLIGSNGKRVLFAAFRGGIVSATSGEEARANTRLAYAAPEMAEVLEALQGEFADLLDSCLIVGTSPRHMDRLSKLEDSARALLARIRGETP